MWEKRKISAKSLPSGTPDDLYRSSDLVCFFFEKNDLRLCDEITKKNEKLKYFKDRIYSILTCKKIFAGRKNLWSDIIRSCVLSGQFSSEICQTKPMESDWHTMLYQIQLPGNCSYIQNLNLTPDYGLRLEIHGLNRSLSSSPDRYCPHLVRVVSSRYVTVT